MSESPTPLWKLSTSYVLELIKNGDLDRYGNVPAEAQMWRGADRPTPAQMRDYIDRSQAGTLPPPMDWQSVAHIYTYYGVGSIFGADSK